MQTHRRFIAWYVSRTLACLIGVLLCLPALSSVAHAQTGQGVYLPTVLSSYTPPVPPIEFRLAWSQNPPGRFEGYSDSGNTLYRGSVWTYEIQRFNISFSRVPSYDICYRHDAYAISATAYLHEGAGYYGFYFGGGYYFMVDELDSTYSLHRATDDNPWEPVVDWTHSDLIKKRETVWDINELRMERNGASMKLMVNGEELITLENIERLVGENSLASPGLYMRNRVENTIFRYTDLSCYYPK